MQVRFLKPKHALLTARRVRVGLVFNASASIQFPKHLTQWVTAGSDIERNRRDFQDFVKENPFKAVLVVNRLHHRHHGCSGQSSDYRRRLGWVRRETHRWRFRRLARADVALWEADRGDVNLTVAVCAEKVDFHFSGHVKFSVSWETFDKKAGFVV